MGQTEKARRLFDEILQSDPFAYETLYEYALLMDRCGEGEAVLKRLEGVVALAEREKKAKEARDVRFIISQLHFLQNDLDKAFMSYQQLAKEDPTDFKPYFCQGLIYRVLNMNDEAQKQFSKCGNLSLSTHQPEGHLRPRL
ncbi:protein SLOW GREEN 1 [Hibiscus syriacus]|uniref:Protein SLOW GREEN 1 n=2 Tax=Hibiscus syriacus TaxID=106335 RepID=A0A6A3BQQ0_HIBSY|nr:protein SLOW GREEN 1 [Hibiscus syriacus]